jgi:LysR family nitrogen assimilation transcriptional regulator
MQFRQLRYFVTIVEQGSLSKALLVLNIAQPALSTHVRNMELELGPMLLLRGAHGVRPTVAGKTLIEHARVVIDRVEQARREIADQQAEPSGEVRLGLPGTIGQVVSVPLILAVRERYPKVKLCVAEAMSGFVLEWAREGRVDLAMVYLGVDDRKLRSSPILTEELRLFCLMGYAGERPAGAVASYEDIARLPPVLPSASHGLRQLLEAEVEAHGVPLGAIIEVDANNSIRELVQTGMGSRSCRALRSRDRLTRRLSTHGRSERRPGRRPSTWCDRMTTPSATRLRSSSADAERPSQPWSAAGAGPLPSL